MRAVSAGWSVLVLMLVVPSAVAAQAPRAGGERLGKVHFATSCNAPVSEESGEPPAAATAEPEESAPEPPEDE